MHASYYIGNTIREAIRNIPKLKPYVAIRALLTMIIPTDVTTLNIHDAASRVAFLSALPVEDIFIYGFQSMMYHQILYCSVFIKTQYYPGLSKTDTFTCVEKTKSQKVTWPMHYTFTRRQA